MKKLSFKLLLILPLIILLVSGCEDDVMTLDPATAQRASIDRFSEDAATLMVRTSSNNLPSANEAVNFDMAPFITKGLGPNGEIVEYYNFDVQSTDPAPIWVLFKEGESMPVEDQLNIIDVIPGDAGYNDFWHVHKVTVPSDYVANTVTSRADIISAGYDITETNTLVNCPVVPEGSTASKGGGTNGLTMGWYKDQLVFYFSFEENLSPNPSGDVPTSPIYVTFNVNPDSNNPDSGPASGFMVVSNTDQTHNVVATLPTNTTNYSPLWAVKIYDNTAFGSVSDLSSAIAAPFLGSGPNVNCPVVSF